MSRKRRRSGDEEVELNLAAMLDMAFQLLTFFILTFKPAPVEGQIALRMPPPQALANANAKVQAGLSDSKDPVQGFNTLAIVLYSDDNGKLTQIDVAKNAVPADQSLQAFNAELKKDLNDPASPFDQVVIQVPAKLHYSELMRRDGRLHKADSRRRSEKQAFKTESGRRKEPRLAPNWKLALCGGGP